MKKLYHRLKDVGSGVGEREEVCLGSLARINKSCKELEICAKMKIINFVTHRTTVAQVRSSICQTNREPLVCTLHEIKELITSNYLIVPSLLNKSPKNMTWNDQLETKPLLLEGQGSARWNGSEMNKLNQVQSS